MSEATLEEHIVSAAEQISAVASANTASEPPPLEAGASSSDADADAATSGKKRELPAGGVPQPRGRPRLGHRWDSTVGEWVPDDAGPVAVTHNPEERAERRQKRVSKQAEKLAAANASLAAGGVDGLKGHEAKALLRAAGQRLGGDKRELKARWKAYSQAQGQSLPVTAVAEAVVAEDVDDDDAEPTSSVEVAAHELVGSVTAVAESVVPPGGAVPPAAEQSPGAAIEVLSTGLSSWTNALGTAV